MLNEKYGRVPLSEAKNPFTCGISGHTYTATEYAQRTEHLAAGLAKEFGWSPNEGTEWDKVVGLFALNTVRINLYDAGRSADGNDAGRFYGFGICNT